MNCRSITLGATAVALASALVLPIPARGAPAAPATTTRITSLPYTISSPGRYLLGASLTGVPGLDGITVSASDVTLDLCGYTLHGVDGSLAGVRVESGNQRVHVLHGGVRGWSSGGVLADLAVECAFEDLFLADNGEAGGLLAGSDARVRGVLAHDNLGPGIRGLGNVSECVTRSNAEIGIDVSGLVVRSTASDNGFEGINVGSETRVESCLALNNGVNGFSNGARATFVGCMARDNGLHGFSGSTRALVTECLSARNAEAGFSFEDQVVLRRNLAAHNGQLVANAPGITVGGTDNRIDENESHGNPVGIQAEGTDNVVVRNSVSDSLIPWDVAAGNYFFTGPPTGPNGWINLVH